MLVSLGDGSSRRLLWPSFAKRMMRARPTAAQLICDVLCIVSPVKRLFIVFAFALSIRRGRHCAHFSDRMFRLHYLSR